MAWLNATPDKAEGDRSKTPAISRRKQYEQTGVEIIYPDCDAEYIAGYLFEIGPTINGDAITHSEIRSFCKNTGIALDPWHCRVLRLLSQKYLDEAHEATTRGRPSPVFTAEAEQAERDKASLQFRSAMASKSFKKPRHGK